MASIYMRIDGVAVNGGATVEGLDGTGWFAVSTYTWGAVRNVSMDIGNANNADSGMVAVYEVSVSKEADGSSEDLLTYLFNPGKEGKTIEIAFTKPEPDGSGARVYFQVKLSQARLVSYNVSGTDGSQPRESISFSYVEIQQKHNYELEGGELKEGGLVIYNVSYGKLLSGTKL